MKKARTVIFLMIFCLFLPMEVQGQERVPEELQELYAQSAVLMDADSGRVLFEKNGYLQRPMASTTKIMTLILALENGDLDDLAEISGYAAGMPDVQLHLREGERYRLKDLLYSLMLESHNDSAVAVAEHIGGTVEGFAAMMNEKARDIGCFATYFITPNGLDAEDEQGVHSTTAADLARLLRYCICQSPKKELFLEITRTPSYSFCDTEGLRQFTVNNKNAFLGMMEGALSGKTGFTNGAGYCYVGALKRGERTFIVSLLACGWPNHRSYKWSDMKKLMNYALNHYTYQEVGERISLDPVLVKNGISADGDLQQAATARLRVLQEEPISLLLQEKEKVLVKVSLSKELRAPLEEGSIVGSVAYTLDGTILKLYPIEAENSVEALTLSWCLKRICMGYFCFLQIGGK